jgi:hypothetical protein
MKIGVLPLLLALEFIFAPMGAMAAASARCALATSAQGPPKASDALGILRTAVGVRTCELCICDTDRSGKVTAPDALAALRFAVGQPVELRCAACPVESTIGPAGGTIVADDGYFEIEFPPGALGANTLITVSGLAPALRDEATEDFPVRDVYVVEPVGLELNLPAEIRLNIGSTLLADGTHSIDLYDVLQTFPDASPASTRGAGIQFVRIPAVYSGGFFYVPASDNTLKLGGDILGEYNFANIGRLEAYLPEVVSVGATATISADVYGYLPTTSVFDHSAGFSDETASAFHPVGGAPFSTPLLPFDELQRSVIRAPYTCDSAGTRTLDGGFTIQATSEDSTTTDSATIAGEVECEEPQELSMHFFPWACHGTTKALADTPAGAKIVCPESLNQQTGFGIYEPAVDEDDAPFALKIGGYTFNDGVQYKVAILPDPLGNHADAFFTAGEGYNFVRWSPELSSYESVGNDPLHRQWYDIAPTIVPGAHPSALLTNSTDDEFYRADYDGTDKPVTPVKILDNEALEAMGLGELISGKLLTPTGPLIGITGPIGESPGSIFVHDLVDPDVPGTVVGPTGEGPECIHCVDGLCVVTNSGDDTMTLVEWSVVTAAHILATAPIGDFPNGSEIRWLGGSRYVILTTGRIDNTITVTVVDTNAENEEDYIESQETMPAGCVTPAFIDFLYKEDGVIVSCQTPGSLSLIKGVVLH